MAAIQLIRVTKTWGRTVAVRDISFEVEEGSFVVLLGPSGCGKSTTLRMIAGLDDVTSGRVLIGGEEMTGAPPAERRVSMVFQSYALFPHLNASENILFGLKARKVAKAEQRDRLVRVAEMVGLADLLDRKPAELSGGQRQRVALARAIIAENPICLMDEPLSNLDAKLRHEMRVEIRALQQRLGMTTVYVTHDQTEAMSMADQVVLMRDGAIEQQGPPAALYDLPETVFAAGFIGTPPMNLLKVEEVGARWSSPERTAPPSPRPGTEIRSWASVRRRSPSPTAPASRAESNPATTSAPTPSSACGWARNRFWFAPTVVTCCRPAAPSIFTGRHTRCTCSTTTPVRA